MKRRVASEQPFPRDTIAHRNAFQKSATVLNWNCMNCILRPLYGLYEARCCHDILGKHIILQRKHPRKQRSKDG